MPEDKRKLNCWIPASLYEKVTNTEYDNTTQAVIKAIENLLEGPREDTKGSIEDIEGYKQDIKRIQKEIEALTLENNQLKQDIIGYQKDIEGYKKDLERIQKDLNQDITGYKENIKALTIENVKLKEELAKAPDRADLLQFQVKNTEIEKHNETLIRELEKAERDKEDLKTTYNNYFLQVQTLINQKAIEAPGEKRKSWYKRIFSS